MTYKLCPDVFGGDVFLPLVAFLPFCVPPRELRKRKRPEEYDLSTNRRWKKIEEEEAELFIAFFCVPCLVHF